MRYGDLVIGYIDQDFIDNLSSKYDIDYYDADICIDYSIANQLIEYIFTTAIQNLTLDYSIKDYLIGNIYCNCFDSSINVSENDLDTLTITDSNNIERNLTNEEKEIIINFINN